MKIDYTMDDFRAEMKKRCVYGARAAPEHGNMIVRTVPCGVHPLHSVKVRANGSRSGCPMCEMQIEALCRVPASPVQHGTIIGLHDTAPIAWLGLKGTK